MSAYIYCDSVAPLIGGFWHGALRGRVLVAVQKHLQRCPDCQSSLERYSENLNYAIAMAESALDSQPSY